MGNNKLTFRVPHRLVISAPFIVMWATLLFIPREITFDVVFSVLLNIALIIVGVWHVSKMTISEKGIVLYLVNKLAWSDITNASELNIFGIKHIRIHRKKGMPWLLPLYFVGSSSVKDALKTFAPKDNPIYKVACGQ